MDYKYIEQLLERYWKCETSLEEEEILRAFFSQKDIPVTLLPYKSLFTYGQKEKETEILGNDFDRKILATIGDDIQVKARVMTIRQRLMPLFKAAAVVAIILTIGNAVQVPFSESSTIPATNMTEFIRPIEEPSVAKADSIKSDSLQQMMPPQSATIIK